MKPEQLEQTMVLIKPDALKNSLTGYVLSQLSEFHTGLRFAGAKIVNVSTMLAKEHYAEHREKPFFGSLLEYITGCDHYPNEPAKRRVIALVYQGENCIKKLRAIAGPTNPHAAREEKPGCIRALGTVVPLADKAGKVIGERMDNLIHASAHAADAEREIKLWFMPSDIPPPMRIYPSVTSQTHYYFKDNALSVEHESGSHCLVAPGEVAWESDLDALDKLHKGEDAPISLEAVAAKYLINQEV